MVAERPAHEERALHEYGTSLGMAFQLVDDALDYAADQRELGKTVGDDFREGKITLPVLAAFEAADAEERAFWTRTVEAGEQTEADLEHAMALIARTGAIETTLRRASGFARTAREALEAFPDGAMRRQMRAVADYTVSRQR